MNARSYCRCFHYVNAGFALFVYPLLSVCLCLFYILRLKVNILLDSDLKYSRSSFALYIFRCNKDPLGSSTLLTKKKLFA